MHVRWQQSLEAPDRQKLEARFRLAGGHPLEGSTWQYDLVDPSSDIIRNLVGDPAVEDTHHIDRASFTISDAERTARRARVAYGGAIVAAADSAAIVLMAFAALLTVVFGGLSLVSLSFFPGMFAVFATIAAVSWAAGMLLWIIAMAMVLRGRHWRVPVAEVWASRLAAL